MYIYLYYTWLITQVSETWFMVVIYKIVKLNENSNTNLDTEMFVFVFTLFLIRLLYSTDISSSAVHASSRIVTKAYGVYMFITMKIICMYPLSTFKTKSCEISYRKKGSSLKFNIWITIDWYTGWVQLFSRQMCWFKVFLSESVPLLFWRDILIWHLINTRPGTSSWQTVITSSTSRDN